MSKSIVIITIALIGPGLGNALALDGLGTEEEPWRIQSLADFDEFAGDANYWDGYTRLETDVNLAGRIYSTAVIGSFEGFFDGNDHKVTGLTIDDGGAGKNYLGLFASIDYPGISNLGLEGGSVSGAGNYVGGLTGYLEGVVNNCYSTVDVNGVVFVGGLVGYVQCSGGIVDCYSTGNVSGGGDVGGLVGSVNCSAGIVNSYSTGNVSGEDCVGGLVGMVIPPLKSPSTGNLSSKYEYGISYCYATGDVNGVDYVGGLVGLNSRRVSNCYSTGKVTGTGRNAGGLLGVNGVVSTFGCTFGLIEDCYWDTQRSGQPKMCGDQGSCSSIGCNDSYGRSTSELHQQSTFANWDFTNTWNIGEDQTYPYLRTVSASDINKDKITNFLDLAVMADQWMNDK